MEEGRIWVSKNRKVAAMSFAEGGTGIWNQRKKVWIER